MNKSTSQLQAKNDAFKHQQKILSRIDVKTIFDVGANIGQTSERYHKYFPDAVIHSFEPCQEVFEVLCKKFENNRLVKTNLLAISDIRGKQNLFMNQYNATDSLLPTIADIEEYVEPDLIKNVGKTTVPVTTIDE